MNINKGIVGLLVGFGVGYGLGVLTAAKFVTEKVESRADKEVEQIRIEYKKKESKFKKIPANDPVKKPAFEYTENDPSKIVSGPNLQATPGHVGINYQAAWADKPLEGESELAERESPKDDDEEDDEDEDPNVYETYEERIAREQAQIHQTYEEYWEKHGNDKPCMLTRENYDGDYELNPDKENDNDWSELLYFPKWTDDDGIDHESILVTDLGDKLDIDDTVGRVIELSKFDEWDNDYIYVQNNKHRMNYKIRKISDGHFEDYY